MFVGHFDESGLDAGSKSFWVAGYVGHMSLWFEFSRAWNKVLGRFGVPAFHATDCANSRQDFAGWSGDQQAAFMDELVSVINSFEVLGFGAGVVKDDYRNLIVEGTFLEDVGLTREWWTEPYLLAFQQCVVAAALKADEDRVPDREAISFVFEEQARFAPRSEAVFAQMRDVGLWPRGDRLGSIWFSPGADSTPLQAADMLVYELRKRHDHVLTGAGRPLRKSLGRLSTRIVTNLWVGKRRLSEVVNEIRTARATQAGSRA